MGSKAQAAHLHPDRMAHAALTWTAVSGSVTGTLQQGGRRTLPECNASNPFEALHLHCVRNQAEWVTVPEFSAFAGIGQSRFCMCIGTTSTTAGEREEVHYDVQDQRVS